MSSEHPEPALILSRIRKRLYDNFDEIVEALTKQKIEKAIKRLMSAMPYVFPNGNKELHTSMISGNDDAVVTPDGDDDSSESDEETRVSLPIDGSSVNDGDDNDSSDSDMDNRAVSPLDDSSSDDDLF